MTLIAPPGPTTLCVEIYRPVDGFVPTTWINVEMPSIREGPVSNVETGAERLRAFLWQHLHRALALLNMEPGTYRIRCAGEMVTDRWSGRAMLGCGDRPPHVTDCGLYACPHR